MKITISRGECGTCRLKAEDGRDMLIQSDTEFPGIASTFGWTPCGCGATDGTVDCAHRTASDMIAEAQKFLDDHIGDRADDPGYFEGDGEEYDPELDADRLLAQQELEDFERADEYFGHGDDGF
jgi:hypothetical protein